MYSKKGKNVANPYLANKIWLNSEWVSDCRAGRATVPLNIRWSPSDICNHHCIECPFQCKLTIPKVQTPIGQVKSLLDDLRDNGVCALEITGGGEPCCHKDIADIMVLGIERFYTAMVTNGTMLHKIPDDSLEKLAWLRISVDAATQETYCRQRGCPGGDWKKVLDSIQRATRLLGDRCSVSFLPYPQSYTEMPAFVRLMHRLGVQNVRFSPLLDTMVYKSTISNIMKYLEQAIEIASGLGLCIHNQMEQRISRDLSALPSYCYYCMASLFVSADLSVSRCCHVAYGRGSVLGNLGKVPLKSIVTKVHSEVALFRPSVYCQGCPYEDRIREIAVMLSMDERDVVFA